MVQVPQGGAGCHNGCCLSAIDSTKSSFVSPLDWFHFLIKFLFVWNLPFRCSSSCVVQKWVWVDQWPVWMALALVVGTYLLVFQGLWHGSGPNQSKRCRRGRLPCPSFNCQVSYFLVGWSQFLVWRRAHLRHWFLTYFGSSVLWVVVELQLRQDSAFTLCLRRSSLPAGCPQCYLYFFVSTHLHRFFVLQQAAYCNKLRPALCVRSEYGRGLITAARKASENCWTLTMTFIRLLTRQPPKILLNKDTLKIWEQALWRVEVFTCRWASLKACVADIA